MKIARTDVVSRWSSQDEGQFFERESAFDRSAGRAKRRNVAQIPKGIAEILSAIANCDAGELVMGIEDKGEVSSVSHGPSFPSCEDKQPISYSTRSGRFQVTGHIS